MSPTNWNRSCMQDILAQLRTNSTKPPGVKAVADDMYREGDRKEEAIHDYDQKLYKF